MPRVVGVDIPEKKAIWVALTYVYGIGRHSSMEILKEAKVEPSRKANKITEDELSRITQIIDRKYLVGGQLRRDISQNISRLKEISCYRGMRHKKNLPVRGQRTRTNARTRKGPRRTVAGKKSVKETRG
jgi:small subunit ribosomal protein S13